MIIELLIVCITLVVLFEPFMLAKAREVNERAIALEIENEEGQ
jgi:hypothetical protein